MIFRPQLITFTILIRFPIIYPRYPTSQVICALYRNPMKWMIPGGERHPNRCQKKKKKKKKKKIRYPTSQVTCVDATVSIVWLAITFHVLDVKFIYGSGGMHDSGYRLHHAIRSISSPWQCQANFMNLVIAFDPKLCQFGIGYHCIRYGFNGGWRWINKWIRRVITEYHWILFFFRFFHCFWFVRSFRF